MKSFPNLGATRVAKRALLSALTLSSLNVYSHVIVAIFDFIYSEKKIHYFINDVQFLNTN